MDTASLANRFRTSYFNQRVRRVDLDAHELELQGDPVIKIYIVSDGYFQVSRKVVKEIE